MVCRNRPTHRIPVLLSSAACEWRHLLQQRHSRLAQGLNHSHGNAWSWECADKHTHLIKTPRPERQLCSRADKVSDRKLRNTRGGCRLAVARYPFFLNDGWNNEIILFSCRKKKSGPLINEPVFTSVSLAEPESCPVFFGVIILEVLENFDAFFTYHLLSMQVLHVLIHSILCQACSIIWWASHDEKTKTELFSCSQIWPLRGVETVEDLYVTPLYENREFDVIHDKRLNSWSNEINFYIYSLMSV